MAAQGTSAGIQDNQSRETFWAEKPFNNSSSEIRDAILRNHFGYTDADVKELREKDNTLFYVTHGNETDWATTDQVKSWKTDTKGGLLIPISRRVIDSIITFRERRASFEIFKVGMFNNDAGVRKQITDALETILSSAGEKRIAALDNLMIAIAGASASREEIFRALRFLSNESGYKNNPFLLIGMARARIYKNDAPAFTSKEVEQAIIFDATRAANENLFNNQSKSAIAKLSKLEVARINFLASNLYRQADAEDKAIQRTWIERYLTISEEERASLKVGDVIEFIPPGVTVMEAPSSNQTALDNLNKEYDKTLKQREQTSRIGNPNPPNDPKDTQYYTKPSDKLELNDALVLQKDRHMKDGKKRSRFTTVTTSVPINQNLKRADRVNSVMDVAIEVLKLVAFDRQMSEVTEYLRKKDYILKQLSLEQRQKMRVVPPRPEVIKQAIERLRRYGITTADPMTKMRVPLTLRELELMLEESYVYYK